LFFVSYYLRPCRSIVVVVLTENLQLAYHSSTTTHRSTKTKQKKSEMEHRKLHVVVDDDDASTSFVINIDNHDIDADRCIDNQLVKRNHYVVRNESRHLVSSCRDIRQLFEPTSSFPLRLVIRCKSILTESNRLASSSSSSSLSTIVWTPPCPTDDEVRHAYRQACPNRYVDHCTFPFRFQNNPLFRMVDRSACPCNISFVYKTANVAPVEVAMKWSDTTTDTRRLLSLDCTRWTLFIDGRLWTRGKTLFEMNARNHSQLTIVPPFTSIRDERTSSSSSSSIVIQNNNHINSTFTRKRGKNARGVYYDESGIELMEYMCGQCHENVFLSADEMVRCPCGGRVLFKPKTKKTCIVTCR
jgi:DNA-directed RNA polymerase subunit RPC12/RpoP